MLEGIRILDCASWIAGPCAGTIASDFGAEVIKIEPPGSGDSYRRKFSNVYYAPQDCYDYPWFVDARNKSSLTLNLKSDEGQEILSKLLKTADVLITNMPLRARGRLKLTYADIKAVKPDIIYASLTPFGEDGPYANDKGFDSSSFWARSGLMDCLRGRHDKPRGSLVGQGDHSTAAALFGGIMLALFDRERTGEGRMVCTSLLHNGIWSNAVSVQGGSTLPWFESSQWDVGVVRLMRSATQYVTSDGGIILFDMIDTEDEFCRFLDILGIKDELTAHPAYKPLNKSAPVVFRDESELIDIVQRAVMGRTRDDLLKAALERGVTLVWVNKITEVKDDPQVLANEMIKDIDADVFGVGKIVDSPLFLSGAKKEIRSKAPEIGQHTDEILKSIGYPDEEIKKLREQRIV